jgi:hypothetical protein
MKEIPVRRITAETPLNVEIHRPGDFQYQDVGYNPIDDPLQAIKEDYASGSGGLARFAFVCPRLGILCSHGSGLIIGYKEKPNFKPTWAWNGNIEKPSLTPSINCSFNGKCLWHDYVTDGKFLKV